MNKEEVLDYLRNANLEEVTPEEIIHNLLQNGEIQFSDYLELQKEIKESMETSEHLDFKPFQINNRSSMTLEEVEKKLQEVYNYQLKIHERLYEISKTQIDRLGELKFTPLESPIGTSGNILQNYITYGIPVIADPTKTYILKPVVLNTESKPLKWYKKLWYRVSSWDIWILIKLVLEILLLLIALMVLYWSIYTHWLN